MSKLVTADKLISMYGEGHLEECKLTCIQEKGTEQWVLTASDRTKTKLYQLREQRLKRPRIFPRSESALAAAQKLGFKKCSVEFINQSM